MMELVARCRAIAEEAHRGQTRKMGSDKGMPYVVHPERMAAKLGDDETAASVAWLHDVAEDTSVGLSQLLVAGVPKDVADAVEALTRKEGETYLDFILRAARNPLAAKVKKADIQDNMESLDEGSLKDKYRLALYILNNMERGGQ